MKQQTIKYKYKYYDEVFYIAHNKVCKGKVTDMNIHRFTLGIVYNINEYPFTEDELYKTERDAKIALLNKQIKSKKQEIKRLTQELKETKNETI